MANLVIVSFLWAFSFSLIKGVLSDLDSNFVSFFRMTVSLAMIIPFLRIGLISRPDRIRLVLAGAVQFGLMYATYIASFRYLPAHMVALLTTTTPLFVTLFNDLSRHSFNRLFFAAAALAVTGGIVIQYPDQPLAASLRGVLLVQISNAGFAFGQLYYKKLAARNPHWKDRQVFGLMYLGAVAITGALSFTTTDYTGLAPTLPQLAALLYLGAVASGICFFLWNKGARIVNEGLLAVMNNLKIPLAIITAVVLLRERTSIPRLFLSFALMSIAVWLCEKCRSKAPLQAGH